MVLEDWKILQLGESHKTELPYEEDWGSGQRAETSGRRTVRTSSKGSSKARRDPIFEYNSMIERRKREHSQ